MSNSSENELSRLLPLPAFLRPGGRSNRQKCPTLLVAWLNDPEAHSTKHGPRQTGIPAISNEPSPDSNDDERGHGRD